MAKNTNSVDQFILSKEERANAQKGLIALLTLQGESKAIAERKASRVKSGYDLAVGKLRAADIQTASRNAGKWSTSVRLTVKTEIRDSLKSKGLLSDYDLLHQGFATWKQSEKALKEAAKIVLPKPRAKGKSKAAKPAAKPAATVAKAS